MDTPLINDLKHLRRHGKWFRQRFVEQHSVQSDLQDGHSLLIEEHVSVEHSGAADLVPDPRLGDGYLSRKDVIDVMVMFNDATAAKDIYRVRDGGVILYDDSTPLAANFEARRRSILRLSGK